MFIISDCQNATSYIEIGMKWGGFVSKLYLPISPCYVEF